MTKRIWSYIVPMLQRDTLKKTHRLHEEFENLWQKTRLAFNQERTWHRAKRRALSALVCLGRHTITGMLTTGGRQCED